MTQLSAAGRNARPLLILGLAACLGLSLACTNEGDTIYLNEGIDCGLIRNDLLGDWVVSFVPASTTLVNCDDGGVSDNTLVAVPSGTRTFVDPQVFASADSTSFVVLGAGPNRPDELKANVEADSCLALVQIWEQDDGAWIQCIGTFDLNNRSLSAVCDSADLDTDPVSEPDVACDLNTSFIVAVSL